MESISNILRSAAKLMALKPLVDAFIKEHKVTFKDTKGNCDSLSNDLFVYLKQHGIDSKIIEGVGLKTSLGDDSPWHEWLKENPKNDPKYLGHVVVRVGNVIVDLTGLQFGSKYHEIIYPYSKFRETWKTIKDGPYWERAKAVLEGV